MKYLAFTVVVILFKKPFFNIQTWAKNTKEVQKLYKLQKIIIWSIEKYFYYLHEAISIVQICSSKGNFDNSIIQENFNFSLEKKLNPFR